MPEFDSFISSRRGQFGIEGRVRVSLAGDELQIVAGRGGELQLAPKDVARLRVSTNRHVEGLSLRQVSIWRHGESEPIVLRAGREQSDHFVKVIGGFSQGVFEDRLEIGRGGAYLWLPSGVVVVGSAGIGVGMCREGPRAFALAAAVICGVVLVFTYAFRTLAPRPALTRDQFLAELNASGIDGYE